jgi:twitching motility protein PilI
MMAGPVPLPQDPRSASADADGACNDSGFSRVGMRLGDGYWLLDLADVSEVIPVPHLLKIPFTKPWFAGVFALHGNLIGVVDFAAFAGKPPVRTSPLSRLVLVAEKHGLNCALLFDQVIGLRHFDQFTRLPQVPDAPAWVEGAYQDDERRTWHALRMPGLVTHREFVAIEATR